MRLLLWLAGGVLLGAELLAGDYLRAALEALVGFLLQGFLPVPVHLLATLAEVARSLLF